VITVKTDSALETLDWRETVNRMDWRPGEHVTLIGPTGAGKTELTIKLIELRRWVLFLATKRIDRTQRRLDKLRFRVISDPAELNPEIASRFTLKPPWPRNASAKTVRELHARSIRPDGRWLWMRDAMSVAG
jgi:ABC-type glutathione transport system ATPase component